MTRTNIYLSDPQLRALRVLADQTGLSVAELVRRALDSYLAQQMPPVPPLTVSEESAHG